MGWLSTSDLHLDVGQAAWELTFGMMGRLPHDLLPVHTPLHVIFFTCFLIFHPPTHPPTPTQSQFAEVPG